MGILDNFKDEYSEFSILNLNFLASSSHDKVQVSLGMLEDQKLDMAQHPREPAAPWAASTAVWQGERVDSDENPCPFVGPNVGEMCAC